MPDQSEAATEHALLQEITAPLQTLPDDPLTVVEADFPTTMRGYDRHAVDDYVEQVTQLVAELHATRSPEAAVRRALERVGEQISGILQRAHETAEQIAAQSRAEAEDRLEQARREAAATIDAAAQRVRELDADTDRIWAERQRIVADAEELAGQLRAVTRDATARFPAEDVPADDPSDAESAPEPTAELVPTAEFAPEPEHPTGAPSVPVADSGRRVIDLRHRGLSRVIGTWVDGDVIIDCGPGSTVEALLEGLGELVPSALLLTHIHFDHAGAAGALVRRWPDLQVYVHERGARHLADPERLYNSARRLYGDEMQSLWGEMVPVPEENLHPLQGGETVLGRYEVAYTPGHASHHVCYLRDDTAFVGDVGGVRITPDAITIPPTPPPDIDLELWHESIQTVRAWAPARLAMTHFGDATDVDAQLDELEARLDTWAAIAREGDFERFAEAVRTDIDREGTREQARQYAQTTPVEQLYAGYERYWAKGPKRAVE